MYLKSLTINGFKSFARKSELEFSTAITGIVGPNGSGKSNVAEAFRFVLGEQSIKSMRGKKGEDLIFNGSQSVSRTNRASVAIQLLNPLKNGTRIFPLDFDEIVIERAVLRDGTNEYSINGTKTRHRDIQELLASANIGPTGHHIISQGEADRILSANPRERREMIEDALGLKVFQFKKAESERKLKKTQENIAQVESLRREVAPHLRFLEKQVKKIERARLLREELTTLYAQYLKREDVYLAYHFERLATAIEVPKKRLHDLEYAVREAKAKLEEKPAHTLTNDIVALEQKMSQVRNERHALVRAIGNLEGQIAFIDRQISEQSRADTADVDVPIARDVLMRALSDIESFDLRDYQGEHGYEQLRAAIVRRLRTVLETAQTKRDTSRYDAYVEERASLCIEKQKAETALSDIETSEVTLKTTYTELKQRVESEQVVNRDVEREMFALMQQQKEEEKHLESLEREQMLIERDREEFKRELQEAVTLVGRGTMEYFHFDVKDENGVSLTPEQIAREERTIQRERQRTLERMKIRLEELGFGAHEDVIKEYNEVRDRDAFLSGEIEDLRSSVTTLESLIADLTQELNEQFSEGIQKIRTEFQTFFALMFGGGSATLERVQPRVTVAEGEDDGGVDGEDVDGVSVHEGIDIAVKLPNKRVSGLSMLSGGERALTSIALIFAMSQVNPPLFVILDETDAALDEANSRRYGDMITALSQKSQLILITHNRETMGRAGVLYGVTMAGDGMSKLLSVKFEEAVAVAK